MSDAPPEPALRWCRVDTDLGWYLLARTARGLAFLALRRRGDRAALEAFRAKALADHALVEDPDALAEETAQLRAYATGARREFDLALDLRGTAFQRRCWDELLRIPCGTTLSYGELALRVGSPKGSRAVGAANGANPVPIVVPCHRVVASDGSLHGFGGGLDLKARLLEHEGVLLFGD